MRKDEHLSSRALLFLLSVSLLGACTDSGEETLLPEGKYPVKFTSQVYGLKVNTRSVSENNTWTGGETVAVQWGSKYNTKNYTAASDGSLTRADDPFYWTKESETVTACYQQGKSFTSMPSIYRLVEDQSTIEKYKQSDLIMACQTVRFADPEKKLKFKHLAAKVIVNLKGDNTVDVSHATVSFINLNSFVSINFRPSEDLSGVSMYPEILGNSSYEVIPYEFATPANGFQKSVQALLPPHNTDGMYRFIKITVNNKGYAYTPSPTDCDMQSGKQYTYNITVRSSGIIERADVQLTESDEWTNGGTEDISSTPVGRAGTLN